ncbi:toxin-antitoxin system YwqK family antitoxin [Psychroserpens sp. SPM9]|uniref:toxin-antitoxin system YwqK family antitoxin n=1 Tax=Psychroserpens sp. SPM9 TaxID=2975598 RepID=UPI0021A6408E|nr:hypothetical protein [Psychroserpens sp. SPM9]MDG5493028.1 hypothetical protein [Psychroserpens sp. SPM9]
MKKTIQLLIICIIFVNTYAQEVQKEYYDNGQLKSIGKGKNPNAPITLNPNQPPPAEGEWKFYYENGKLKSIGSYKKGRRTDFWKYYYENGQIESEGKWTITSLTSKKDGVWKFYHENGKLKAMGSYSFHDIYGHQMHGEWKSYDENGQLFTIQNYDGAKVTWMKEYNVNTGKIQREYQISNDLDYWKFYYENGQIESEGHTNTDSKQVGVWKSYYPNHQLGRIVNYSNGLMDGKETVYYKNGVLFKVVLWENNKLMNIISYNDNNGNELDYGDFKDGNGTLIYYDSEGKLDGKIEVVNGVIQNQ